MISVAATWRVFRRCIEYIAGYWVFSNHMWDGSDLHLSLVYGMICRLNSPPGLFFIDLLIRGVFFARDRLPPSKSSAFAMLFRTRLPHIPSAFPTPCSEDTRSIHTQLAKCIRCLVSITRSSRQVLEFPKLHYEPENNWALMRLNINSIFIQTRLTRHIRHIGNLKCTRTFGRTLRSLEPSVGN